MSDDPLFLKACRREPTARRPVWLMRQAGRYMAEYRALRAKVPFKDLCRRSELACEVTVTAAERIGADAAILFSDILLILEPMGASVEYVEGTGPRIDGGVAAPADVDRLRAADPEGLDFVYEAVRLCRAALPPGRPLIGFAGGPFTLASYLIEGGPSRDFAKTKTFLHLHPESWDALMAKLVDGLVAYLRAQVAAGGQALQLFDSWVGCLSPDDYRARVLPHTKRLFTALDDLGVPRIHFGTGTATLLELQKEAGGEVIGVDFRIPIAAAWDRLGDVAVQGNLDPAVLLTDRPTIEAKARAILAATRGRPGHIFNLGHGVLPSTPVDHVRFLIDLVHEIPAG